MAIDLKDVVAKGEAVESKVSTITRLATAIEKGKTSDGTSLHADTIATMRSKVPAAKTAYEDADVAFRAAMTP